MPSVADIYSQVRPVQLADPLEQAGRVMSIKSMLGAQQLQDLQRQQAQRGLDQDTALQNLYAGATPEQMSAADFYRQLIATGGAKGAALAKTLVEGEKAKADLKKTNVETHGVQVKQLRDMTARVQTDADLAALRDEAVKVYGPNASINIPQTVNDPNFKAWQQREVMDADKFIDRNKPKFEKVDLGGQIKMVDTNPETNPAIRTMSFKKVIGPEAALHARVQAATQDPFGNLGIREMVEGQINGGGAQRPGQPPAGATAGMADVHGDDFLKTLPSAQSVQIKALAEGRQQFPTGQALRTPYWQNMIQQVAQYAPSFDAVNYNARSATRKAFTSGSESKSLNALNTVMGHLDELDKTAKDLNNSGFTPWNEYISNPIAGAVSPEFKARLNKFNLTKQAVVDEMEKAYRGTAGAQAGIDAWKKTLSSADSYQALRASIQQGVKLLNSKMEALGDQYSKGMGTTKSGLELLNPHAQSTFNRLVRDADAGGAAAPKQSASGGIKFLGFE